MANINELRLAQKSLYNGARQIGDAGMRLNGTKYEADYRKAWTAIEKLNNRLIADIRKEGK